MDREELNMLLAQVAQAYETTPQLLEKNIILALEQRQDTSNHDPATLEEYVAYLARTLPQPFSP